jgi:hypothetical protein
MLKRMDKAGRDKKIVTRWERHYLMEPYVGQFAEYLEMGAPVAAYACVRVGVRLYVRPCGCASVCASVWVCVCMCVRVGGRLYVRPCGWASV